MELNVNVPTAMVTMQSKTAETRKWNGSAKSRNLWIAIQISVDSGLENGGQLSTIQGINSQWIVVDQGTKIKEETFDRTLTGRVHPEPG